uniref:Uncharacterized protein n=1 Tax=Anguilla anguilla TaxID=7936 RepID=A0A0E9QN31_ANGAN
MCVSVCGWVVPADACIINALVSCQCSPSVPNLSVIFGRSSDGYINYMAGIFYAL